MEKKKITSASSDNSGGWYMAVLMVQIWPGKEQSPALDISQSPALDISLCLFLRNSVLSLSPYTGR